MRKLNLDENPPISMNLIIVSLWNAGNGTDNKLVNK